MHRMDSRPNPHGEPLPQHVEPMLATLGTLPPGAVDDQWAYEMKWDGVRALVPVAGGRVALTSRNDIHMSVAYPELRALGEQISTPSCCWTARSSASTPRADPVSDGSRNGYMSAVRPPRDDCPAASRRSC